MEEEKEEIAIPAVPVDFFQLMIDGSSKQWRWGRRGESSNRSQWREERLLIEKMSMRKKMQLGRYPCSRCNQPRSRGGETSMATTAAAAAAAKCRCSRRRRLPEREWTAEEDERLRRLAKENLFRQWWKVAREMPGRSGDSCRARWRHHLARDVYHRPFTARDDEELVRLHRHTGGSWRKISRSVYGRTSAIMRDRWIQLRRSGLVPDAAKTAENAGCPPPAADDSEYMGSEAESKSPPPPPPQQQHPLADVLASSLDSCTLASDATDPRDGILALDFAFMSV
ncbi:hypothetical protein OsI_08755 [Oryza sativa Indica Group]|jgi:hypothetical protein|uniref:Uncharacterized protein n=1 Tax=Oryza sativa subsp. indica TaxID=39946 RepID=A2X942_ORYSI|nr:hypothetical protein OsI_08755 [Oryza sativa Indica Group]